MLSEDDLEICLSAFNKSADAEAKNAFEQILLNNLPMMGLETASSILYTYAKERRGENEVLEGLIYRVESEQDKAAQLPGSLLAEIIVSLNLCGRTESSAFHAFRA